MLKQMRRPPLVSFNDGSHTETVYQALARLYQAQPPAEQQRIAQDWRTALPPNFRDRIQAAIAAQERPEGQP